MTDQDMLGLLQNEPAQKALRALGALPAPDRRRYAKPVLKLYKEMTADWQSLNGKGAIRHPEALRIGVLATASLSELERLAIDPIPGPDEIVEVFRTLAPDWIDGWVTKLIEKSPYLVPRLAPLWEAGLCSRPTSDAYILGYYAHHGFGTSLIESPDFLERDVWRFFGIEGGGEFSLAAHDKYAAPQDTWAVCLLELVNSGKLDRARVLDATLSALARDFGQFRAGWYSRFHTALAPTEDEISTRADLYLGLLSSTVPPTVSMALKTLQPLAKAGKLAPQALLDALDTPVQARQKSTALAALRLIATTVQKAPEYRHMARSLALGALVSEAADVQSKALDLIEKCGPLEEDDRQMLADHAALVAPSLRNRLSALSGVAADTPAPPQTPPTPSEARSITPVADAEAALALFLAVLEDPRDPFRVEASIDGLMRFGTTLRADPVALSPLKKRAHQKWQNPGEGHLRAALAAFAVGFAEGQPVDETDPMAPSNRVPDTALTNAFHKRNKELLALIRAGATAPMLSAPTDTAGCVAPAILAERLAHYRVEGLVPSVTDMSLALMRLDPDGRDAILQTLSLHIEAERALAYALGAPVPAQGNAGLWAAAWAARLPVAEDPAISKLFRTPLPDCGAPAHFDIAVSHFDRDCYRYIEIDVPVTPAIDTPTDALPAMPFVTRKHGYFLSTVCGSQAADVAWASLFRPAALDAFFRCALMEQDPDQKLKDHFCRAYLDPIFRPGPPLRAPGAAALVYLMGFADKSVSSLAAEAMAAAHSESRLTTDALASALQAFIAADALPVKRWTTALAEISARAPEAATFVRDVLDRQLDTVSQTPPRDFGGMLELLYELCISTGATVNRPAALSGLTALSGGGKLATFRTKLLKLSA